MDAPAFARSLEQLAAAERTSTVALSAPERNLELPFVDCCTMSTLEEDTAVTSFDHGIVEDASGSYIYPATHIRAYVAGGEECVSGFMSE
mmetsp:Transcript_4918/g.10150  ORF Transcript_4918/g.10150 Transcript_4918/m.10150 type:complete len:90 (-) Transcript_4918:26-295(-)